MVYAWAWLKAVACHWKAELLSGVVIGLVALFSEFSGITVPPRGYEIAAAVALSYAMFLAWRDEHVGRLETRQEIAQVREQMGELRKAHAPDLLFQIEDWQQQIFQLAPNEGFGSNVLLDVSIRNSGARTGLADWKLEMPLLGGGSEKPRDDDWQRLLIRNNHAQNLVLITRDGVDQGDIVRGLLVFTFHVLNKETLDNWDPHLILTCIDARGQTHVIESRRRPSEPAAEPNKWDVF